MEKWEFIAKYLEKKLKNCKLHYGLQYLCLVGDLEKKAEKLWNKKNKDNI